MLGLPSEPIVETIPNEVAEAVVLVVPGEGDPILLEELELTLARQRSFREDHLAAIR
jgi:hypothetical protein